MACASWRWFFCGYGSDACRHDLATLRNVTLKQAHIFIIDLWRVIPVKRVGLAAAEKRFCCHDSILPLN